MNVPQKIFSNTAYIILGNFINKLISLFILILLTRHLGVADFGKLSFVIFYVTFFGIFTDFGLNTILVRECSRHPDMAPRLVGNVISTKFVFALISALAASLVIFVLDYPSDIRLLVYIASIMLFISFRGIFFRMIFEAPFQVYLKMHYPSIINVFNEIFTLVVIIAVTALQGTLLHVMVALTLANLPGFLIIAYFSTKLIRPVFDIDMALIRRMLKEAFPLGISGFLESLFILLPVFILTKLADDIAVGHYSLAFRLASSLWIIPTAFMMSLYPYLSRYAEGSEGELKKACLAGLKAMSLLAIPMAVLVVALANPVIKLISGIAYEPATTALQFLIVATAIYFLNTVFTYTFNAANLQNTNLLAWGVMTGSVLVLTITLVPFFDFKGAALAVVIALFAGFITYAYMATRTLGTHYLKLFVKFLFAGMMMGGVMIVVGTGHSMIGVILGTAAYMAAVYSLKIFSEEDFTIVREMLI